MQSPGRRPAGREICGSRCVRSFCATLNTDLKCAEVILIESQLRATTSSHGIKDLHTVLTLTCPRMTPPSSVGTQGLLLEQLGLRPVLFRRAQFPFKCSPQQTLVLAAVPLPISGDEGGIWHPSPATSLWEQPQRQAGPGLGGSCSPVWLERHEEHPARGLGAGSWGWKEAGAIGAAAWTKGRAWA